MKKTKKAQKTSSALERIGRDSEIQAIRACLLAERNVLLEGPVGVGKTHLALSVIQEMNLSVFRVDGDSRYTDQKLTGWFDPPLALKKGFNEGSFVPGPLLQAMKAGGILFINELNRLPEGVQNVLLPAIDEKMIVVPRLGVVRAKKGFLVIATQNPKEFVATSHLSEAILDRFELVVLDYQSVGEEVEIVMSKLKGGARDIAKDAVALTRWTRNHPRIKRGASVRGAISIAEITESLMSAGRDRSAAFIQAALIALPTRIEISRDVDSENSTRADLEMLLTQMAESVLKGEASDEELKKKL